MLGLVKNSTQPTEPRSIEPTGGMREHGVDLAGLRREIGACHRLSAVILRNLLEQALELADIAIDRAHEVAVAAILATNLLERLLPLIGVKLAREHVLLAAIVTIPEVGRGVVIDHARDVDGKRVERFERRSLAARTLLRALARRRRFPRRRRLTHRAVRVLRGAREQVGQPTGA